MKNYRYHVLQENRAEPVSTHRNPIKAFQEAIRLLHDTPKRHGVKDTKCGGFFEAGSAAFGVAYTNALYGEWDFHPQSEATEG